MIIEKKTWPELFEKVLIGEKTFDVRIADFDVKEGDILVLREWDPIDKRYTGREIRKKVGFVLHTKDITFWKKEDVEEHGFHVMSLLEEK